MGAGVVATLLLGPLGLFVLMLATSKRIADSHQRQINRDRRKARKHPQAFRSAIGAGGPRGGKSEGYWYRKWRQEKNAHGKTKQDKRQSDAAAKESQRLHVNEVRDHEKTRQHYDAGLIYIRDVLSWKKKRLILLFPDIREYIDKLRSGKVPRKIVRGGKIRGGKGR